MLRHRGALSAACNTITDFRKLLVDMCRQVGSHACSCFLFNASVFQTSSEFDLSTGANLYDKSRQPFKPPERNIQNSVVANSSVINSPTNKLMGQHSEKAIGVSFFLPGRPGNPSILEGCFSLRYDRCLQTAEAMLAAGVGKAGKEELNALAQMIAPRRVEADNFKLNLFPDSDAESPVTTYAAFLQHFLFKLVCCGLG